MLLCKCLSHWQPNKEFMHPGLGCTAEHLCHMGGPNLHPQSVSLTAETTPQSNRALAIGTIRHSWDHQEKFHLDGFTWGLLKALLPSCCSHQMWPMTPGHAAREGWASACFSKRPLQYHQIQHDFLSESCTWTGRKCRSHMTWVE